MPDAYLNTATSNFNKTTVELILRAVQRSLRGGTVYAPRGSIIPAALVSGTNGVFRSFGYSDLPEDGAVSIEDGQPDPDAEDISLDFVEFTGVAKGRTIGVTDNAKARSPHNLATIAVDKVSRDILVSVDNVPRALYSAAAPELFGGTGNTQVSEVAAGDILLSSAVKQAVAILRMRDVKPLANGFYACVANPLVFYDLMLDDDTGGWLDSRKYADKEALLTGEMGRYAGCAFIDAGSRGIVHAGAGTGSIDVSIATVIGAEAVFAALGGLTVIPVTGPDKSDPLNRRDLYSWKGFLGGILNDVQANRFVNIAVATTL